MESTGAKPAYGPLQRELYELLRSQGAALVGAADLRGVDGAELPVGVAVATPVPASIVQELKTAPTREYYDAYHELNARLDRMVEAGAEFLRRQGWQAAAHTTKTVAYDRARFCTPLPHKTVATRAGLGWIGKNCLLVTQEYGSAVRICSLVTDAPLATAAPILESRCGGCKNCVAHCPGRALTGALWRAGMPRQQLLDVQTCRSTQIRRMKAATGIDTDLCGLCFAVCPYTRRYLNRAL